MPVSPRERFIRSVRRFTVCAICNAEFFDSEEDPAKWRGDPFYEWETRAYIIGENRFASTIEKVFLSEEAYFTKSRSFHARPGEHPNSPKIDPASTWSNKHLFVVYDFATSDGFAVPIHRECVSTIQAVWGVDLRKEEGLRHLQALYDTFRCLTDDREESDAKIPLEREYHDPRGLDEWCLELSDAGVVDPTERNRSIVEYFLRLARSARNRFFMPRYRAQDVSWLSKDRLSNLLPELMQLVLLYLPTSAIDNLRKASPNVAQLELGNVFWKQKLQIDAPWLYEFDELFAVSNNHLDWQRLYYEIIWMEPRKAIQGLVNRRRIWSKCEFLVASCRSRLEKSREMHSRLSRADSPGVPGVSSHPTVRASPMGRLMCPSPAYFDTSTLYFDHELGRAEHGPRVFSVYWTSGGVLSGFGIAQKHGDEIRHEQRIGHKDRFGMCNSVEIGTDNCLIGLIVNMHGKKYLYDVEDTKVVGLDILLRKEIIQLGERNGNKKRFDIVKNSILVGIHAEFAFDGQLSALCLLHSQTVPDCCQQTHRQCQDLIAHQSIGSRLWRNQVPPPDVQLSPWEFNSWDQKASGSEVDFSSMEPLLFGRNNDELAEIVELVCGAKIGAFEIRYSNGESRSIGPCLEDVTSLSIDGPGGERIVAVDVGIETSSIITQVTFTTNFKRSLVVGKSSSSCGTLRLDPPDTGEEGLCGIYTVWASTDKPPETIGLMLNNGAVKSLGDWAPYRLHPSKRLCWALGINSHSPWGP